MCQCNHAGGSIGAPGPARKRTPACVQASNISPDDTRTKECSVTRAPLKKTTRVGTSTPRQDFSDPAVDAVFDTYPTPLKSRLLALRRLIFETARTTPGVGALQEILKWGQPSYLTAETKSGSTVRIDQVKSAPDCYAIYFHCQTDLVATFRELYPTEFTYGGNRSILLNAKAKFPEPALRHCIALALTYHLNRRKAVRKNA